MRSSSSLVAAACIAIGLAFPVTTSAAEPTTPIVDPWPTTDQDAATVADLRASADAHFQKGNFRAALVANLAAYRLAPSRATVCNAGMLAREVAQERAADSAANYELAAELLQNCTAQYKLLPATTAEEQKIAARYFRELALAREELAELRIIAPDAGADISIGSRSIGRGPIEASFWVVPGAVEVTARRGQDVARRALLAERRRTHEVRLELPPKPEDAEPPNLAPLMPPLRIQAPEPPPSPRDPVVIAGTATSGAGAVAGAILFGISGALRANADSELSKADSLTGMGCFQSYRAPLECRSYRDDSTHAENLARAGFVSVSGAAAAGVATLIYASLAKTKSQTLQAKGIGMVIQWQ